MTDPWGGGAHFGCDSHSRMRPNPDGDLLRCLILQLVSLYLLPHFMFNTRQMSKL